MNKKISFGDEYWVYSEENEKRVWKEVPLKFLREMRNKEIIEVGSGYGVYLYYLSKHNKVKGVEIDEERVEDSKKNLKKLGRFVEVIRGDARKLPFQDGSFDVVFCHGVIEHFNETEMAIMEGYRVLRNGGIAVYSVPARISFFVMSKVIQQIIGKLTSTDIWKAGYEKSFTPWRFKKMLKNAGFRVIHFEISQTEPGRKYPFVGGILRLLDKPFWKLKIGGRFMYAVCKRL